MKGIHIFVIRILNGGKIIDTPLNLPAWTYTDAYKNL